MYNRQIMKYYICMRMSVRTVGYRLALFQSYQDDGRVIKKGYLQWNFLAIGKKIPPPSGPDSETARSEGRRVLLSKLPGFPDGLFYLYEEALLLLPWSEHRNLHKPIVLTLKAPITTAADDIHKEIFSLFFRENKT